ncbi:hypothetical protein GCM10023351_25510 [Microbacterium gilvum]|uniref:Uncharacterized protein n=1 Tax=Microbacterium gilvum TaxID=1336204 RepID=A0ABP9AEU3_9MICO
MPHDRTVVVSAAIHFEDDAAAEDEVDAPDAVDHDLASHGDPEAEESEAQDRFEAAARIASREVDQSPLAGVQLRAHRCALSAREEPQRPGGFERREERFVALAACELHERAHDVDQSVSGGTVIPMRDACACGVRTLPPVRAERDVHDGGVECPYAELLEDGGAAQHPAVLCGRQDLRIDVGCREHTGPDGADGLGIACASQISASGADRPELPGSDDAAAVGDAGGDLGGLHPVSVAGGSPGGGGRGRIGEPTPRVACLWTGGCPRVPCSSPSRPVPVPAFGWLGPVEAY